MAYEVGDVVETTEWSKEHDGFYIILEVRDNYTYLCKALFCRNKRSNKRSFTSGVNRVVGHIDDISGFLAELGQAKGGKMLDQSQRRNAELLVSRAKIAMLESHPFYAHILTRLTFELDESLVMPGTDLPIVSATDGKRILINPLRYVMLSKGEQVTTLAHEQLHCLDGHLWRRGQRDPLWANVAQDIYIYHVLRSEGFTVLADNAEALTAVLHKHAKRNAGGFAYDLDNLTDMFWEQIYEAIVPASQSQQSSGGQGQGDDSGQPGQGQPQPGKDVSKYAGGCYHEYSGTDARETAEQWKQWVREAGLYAKMAGAAPGRWQELVDAATPQPPFETRFFGHLKRGLGGDQSFDAFSRRAISRGEYLPQEVVEVMGETVLVNDTSGSRTTDDLAYAYGVFRTWRSLHPCVAHCVDMDTEAHWRTFKEDEELPVQWEAHGRGGTRFAPLFVTIREKKLDPSLIVYFTDGFLSDEDDLAEVRPECDVIWVLTGAYRRNWKPPFGQIVEVSPQEVKR